uniref:Putative chitin binding peritrophin-a domain protein n=1 Tax=Rhodnius prolixus TaxID=13249 RepID=R4FKS3_RHOPR
MLRILGYGLLLLKICGNSLAFKCNQLGIFSSTDPTKFILCTERNGELISAEFSCSNTTIYSGSNAKCVPHKDNSDGNRFNFLHLGDKTAASKEVSLDCITPGVICSDCGTLTFCVGETTLNGTTSVRVLNHAKCVDGEHCAVGVGCTTLAEHPCSVAPFVCDDLGVFPDPYDCRKYHICTKQGSYEYRCSTGSFNSHTATCGYSLQDGHCYERPVPFCQKTLQVGSLPTDASYYYICVRYKSDDVLRPSLHRCPANKQFNETTFTCS